MAGAPTYQLLLDDGTGTFPYNITAYWRRSEGYELNRGRGDERSDVEAGELKQVVLNNKDGRFTPGSTIIASPSPIVADQRIRLQVTANGTTVNRFTGYVPSWVNSWPGGKALSVVTVAATDAQARAERRTLLSVVQEEIFKDSPAAYYPLGEPAGATSAADSTGNQAPSLVAVGNVAFGDSIGTLAAVRIDATVVPTGTVYTPAQITGVVSGLSVSGVCFAFSVSSLASKTTSICVIGVDGVGHGFGLFQVNSSGVLTFIVDGFGSSLSSTARVDDGGLHVAEVQYSAGTWTLYLDGSAVASVAAAAPSSLSRISLENDNTSAGATVRAAHLALLSTGLDATRAAARASAIRTGFAGETGTARLTRLAGYANLPVGTLDTSFTNVPFVDFTDQSLAEALRDVADAEVGIVFFDGSGNLMFHNRMRAPLKTAPDITIPAEALDVGTQFVTDMQGILNYFEATASGTGNGAQVARNTASETSHGRYPGSQSYLVQTDAEALDRAKWIVATHAEPQARVGTLEIDAFSQTAALQAQLLALEPNTWVRITGLPSQTPGGTTADLMVQGFNEKASAREWKITANVVARSMFQAWILGDSVQGVLDSTTRLYI